MKRIYFVVIISIIFGTAVSFITGFFTSPVIVCGSQRWGFPIDWKWRMVVGPQYTAPINIQWTNFFINTIFWIVIMLVIFAIIYRKNLLQKV